MSSVEVYKELDDFFRSMRQAYNRRDMKLFRSHFWTDKRFINLDASGRSDQGWGAYEEILDQELRYHDTVKLEFRDMEFRAFGDRHAFVAGHWTASQVDPEGRENSQSGRCSFSVAQMNGEDWKIVGQHFSLGND